MKVLHLIHLTAAVIAQVNSSCPAVCDCPAEPPVCPPGVSLVPDGCACCLVCAAQLNQDCSLTRPCDRHKGLECNHGNDVTAAWGVCRAKSDGRTCEYNGRIYQNGESFRAGCKHQCTCVDGAVGCSPLCSNKLPPSSPSCPYPRLVRAPGQCCFSVDCRKDAWFLPPEHKVSKLSLRPPRRRSDEELILTNQLPDSGPTKHLPEWNTLQETSCLLQTTDWSQCSRSCGTGVSSRITNDNARCALEKETRICTLRPCGGLTAPAKNGRSCSPTHKAPRPVFLSHGECLSVRPYRPNYCGVCTDGRCCSPRRSRTVSVTFVCPDGERFQRSAMFIQSCKCSRDCGHLNEVALPPQQWLYGDTHTFTE
ncbi:Protein CYR61 [Oryzias melastigma]|uniref:Protein CYR61 n=1 Tax=Oryzias melastigma TaxID=30732 RepID=A0A834CJ13_ORYME|nr:Protein CYR61 [Oryzias melastigma]